MIKVFLGKYQQLNFSSQNLNIECDLHLLVSHRIWNKKFLPSAGHSVFSTYLKQWYKWVLCNYPMMISCTFFPISTHHVCLKFPRWYPPSSCCMATKRPKFSHRKASLKCVDASRHKKRCCPFLVASWCRQVR